MKQLVIEFEGSWILSHREDKQLPVILLKNELLKMKGVQVKSDTHTEVVIVCDEKDANPKSVETFVISFLAKKYPKEEIPEIVSFHQSDLAEEKGQESKGDKDKEELERRRRELTSLLDGLYDDDDEDGDAKKADKKDDGKTAKSEPAPTALNKIESLIGALEFKALAKEIASITEEIKRTKTFDVFTNRCYLFSIGDGCGLTTYLELLGELVTESGLCKMALHPVREVALGPYREGMEPFAEASQLIERGTVGSVRLLCIDISEWMDKTENRYFKQFLRLIEKHAEEFIVVFRVPFVDKDVLSRIGYSLSDLLSLKTISFPPLNREEIQFHAQEEFKRHGFTVGKTAWRHFFDRISEEKSDGKFYGVNTVKKVVREAVYQKHLNNAQKKQKSYNITLNDTRLLCSDGGNSDLSGSEQLNKLVGVDAIKKRVEEIIAQIEFAIKNGADRPCIHMRFVGNPGTGKTTVARIIGKILNEKGILRVGAFFEYGGRDFCGRYIGETAPKTASICRDAYGSVLFIDEAYSLYRGDDDTRDFGREAIDTLIAEMENHRNDFVVIMAGYTDEMNKLMGGNTGLLSRMPYTIEFPNFTREQLYDIFVSMATEKFKCDQGLLDTAHDFFMAISDEVLSSKDFANARYARNLFERTWAKAALRCQLNGTKDVVLTREDFEHASADKDFGANAPKKTRLGF